MPGFTAKIPPELGSFIIVASSLMKREVVIKSVSRFGQKRRNFGGRNSGSCLGPAGWGISNFFSLELADPGRWVVRVDPNQENFESKNTVKNIKFSF